MPNVSPNTAREISAPTTSDSDRELLRSWSLYLESGGRTQGTVDTFLWRMQSFADTVPSLLEATTEDCIRYIAARRRSNAAETRRAIRTCLRSFYRWAFKTRRIAEDPTDELPAVKIPRQIGRVAPDVDLQLALQSATTTEQAMVLLARDGCLRLSELTTLRTEHRRDDVLRVRGKGEHIRIVPLTAGLLDVLMRLERMQGEGFYFPGRYGGEHMHSQSVHKIIKRVTGWHPHALRHAGATAAFRATGDLRAVQELLGHASVATTQRYIHVGEEQVRRAAIAGALLTGDAADGNRLLTPAPRLRRAS